MSIAFISISARGAKRYEMMKFMAERLSYGAQIIKSSDVYETKDKKETVSDTFLSVVLEIETDMKSHQLLQFILESSRQINSENQSPTILKEKMLDCDLIDLHGELNRTQQVTLPHPEAHFSAHIIIPLSEIEPNWEHPVLKKKAFELAQAAFWSGWGSFFKSGQSLLDF